MHLIDFQCADIYLNMFSQETKAGLHSGRVVGLPSHKQAASPSHIHSSLLCAWWTSLEKES